MSQWPGDVLIWTWRVRLQAGGGHPGLLPLHVVALDENMNTMEEEAEN